MKYTFTRKQILNAFNNKILDDDNFLTYLLSTTSKDIPMNQKSLDKGKGIKEKLCPKCNKIMRPWFDRQEFVGWNCGDCFNTFIKKNEPKITR